MSQDGGDTLYLSNNLNPKSDYAVLPKPNTGEVLRQQFEVKAPQFNLDPNLINTYYPPSGQQDEGRILPHIVFNDPHAPWLRAAGHRLPTFEGPIDPDPVLQINRSMVPWIAVLVFDPAELLVQPGDATATGLSSIASYNAAKLPPNGAFPMTVGDYITKIPTHRIDYESDSEFNDLKTSTDATSIIFPTKGLIKRILGTKDSLSVLESYKVSAPPAKN